MDLNITICLPLLVWALVVNVAGYWAGRTKVKEWAVPLPVLTAVLSVVLVCIWGVIAGTVAMYDNAVRWGILYVLPNAACILALATYGYDIIHAFGKVSNKWVAMGRKIVSVFKKGEKV